MRKDDFNIVRVTLLIRCVAKCWKSLRPQYLSHCQICLELLHQHSERNVNETQKNKYTLSLILSTC
jgi:hypothetical protein